MDIKTKLFGHQQDTIDTVKSKPYHAIIHEPGLGKTLSALGIVIERVKKCPTYRTLYVCPNTLIENVIEEAALRTDLHVVALTGSRERRTRLLAEAAHVFVINYEGTRVITDELVAAKFNLIICDESHCLANHRSEQSKACFRIAMSCPHRLIMTGTFLLNRPLDAFGQVRILTPDIFGASFYRFRAAYCVMGGFMGKQITKYINMPRFVQKLRGIAHVRTKDQCLDLPPRLYETIRVDLPAEQTRMYADLRRDFITTVSTATVSAPVVLTRMMRFSQITAGFYKTTEGEECSYAQNPKHEWLIEWLKENGHKTVIFVRFIKELKDLEAALDRAGISYVSVYGATKDRIEHVKHFNLSPVCQVFIGMLSVAGQGINLQSASYCVFLSNEYSFGDREQAECRIHRAGQLAENCTYIDVIARGTIDEHVLKVIKAKGELSSMVLSELVKCV